MPSERWVVVGTGRYGEPFEWPGQSGPEHPHSCAPTRAAAEDTAGREVWNGPAAAYRRAD